MADFITGDDHLTVLSTSNKLEFDKTSEVFSKHPLTSDEIRQSCEDLKVLGPRELKQLVKWREKMRKFLDDAGSDSEGGESGDGVKGETGEEREGEDKMLEGIDDKIKSLERTEAAEVKRYMKSSSLCIVLCWQPLYTPFLDNICMVWLDFKSVQISSVCFYKFPQRNQTVTSSKEKVKRASGDER